MASRRLPADFRSLTRTLLAPGALTLAAGCAALPGAPPASSPVEDIHVLRSLRVERTNPSSWCTPERAGFRPLRGPSLLEDRFTMHAMALSGADGRVIDPHGQQAGELRACLGFTPDPKVLNFYVEGSVAGVPVAGSGDCRIDTPNHPEPGITPVRCFVQLRDLPPPYVGGLLTSSTVVSKAVLGLATDPPGYLHSSVATIRLWRPRRH